MSNSPFMRIEQSDAILTIAWNRPEKKNAITQEMYGAAADALEMANKEHSIRAVVITGTKDCFTAGNDLADFLDNPAMDEHAPVTRFLRNIASFEKPLIAAVNGVAVGVGTTMLLHCDMVVAADSAVLSLPFVKLGLCPEAASSYLLPLLGGHQRAAELLMLGEAFSPETARECGIVNRVTSAEEYQALARSIAKQLVQLPPSSLRSTKSLLKGMHLDTIHSRIDEEAEIFANMLSQPEAIEAMSAFMERRPADFSRFA